MNKEDIIKAEIIYNAYGKERSKLYKGNVKGLNNLIKQFTFKRYEIIDVIILRYNEQKNILFDEDKI